MPAIHPLRDEDVDAAIALWRECDLVRPWNDPRRDIELARGSPSSEVFVACEGDGGKRMLVASVLAGADGHRGWLYYLAVAPAYRGRGIGRAMVGHAERWLANRGMPKVQLMVRDDNVAVRGFYEAAGYEVEPRTLLARWLKQ